MSGQCLYPPWCRWGKDNATWPCQDRLPHPHHRPTKAIWAASTAPVLTDRIHTSSCIFPDTHNVNAPWPLHLCVHAVLIDFLTTHMGSRHCMRTFALLHLFLLIVLFRLLVFRQWWRVTLETGQDTCAMWITPTAMGDVSHAYITLIKIGLPRYVNDVWSK